VRVGDLEVDDALLVWGELPPGTGTMFVRIDPDVRPEEVVARLRATANLLQARILDGEFDRLRELDAELDRELGPVKEDE